MTIFSYCILDTHLPNRHYQRSVPFAASSKMQLIVKYPELTLSKFSISDPQTIVKVNLN